MLTSKPEKTFRLAELASYLDAKLVGDGDSLITGIASLQSAQAKHLSFLTHATYRRYLSTTKASAVILSASDLSDCPTHALVVDNPHVSYAKLTTLFLEKTQAEPGIHPSVVQGTDAQIHPTATISAHVVLGQGVQIGQQVVIEPGCVVGDQVVIGEGSHLAANVSIADRVCLGERVRIHAGAVIGADGFGFAKHHDGSWEKIHQLGTVIIGDDVEIGANTTIDRGALGNTVIGHGVKLDNQIQIAHNVVIGDRTIIAACTGIAGSTRIGKDCMIGGGVGINDHIQVTDGVCITAMSGITKSIIQPGFYSSGLPQQPSQDWRRSVVRFKQLDQMAKRLKKLEAQYQQLEENNHE